MSAALKKFKHLEIPLEAIESATNNFAKDHLIGEGGFGKVYKGELLLPKKGHTTVALKRLDRKSGQGDSEFWKEVMMLSVYKHQNIVSFLGYCYIKDEMILVYEFASKKSLDLHLGSKELTWVRRLKICIGAARGLSYLHNPAGTQTQQRVLHRDIKSSNILLDENWNAKIADFGLSKLGPANQTYTFVVSNNMAGTIGYCDPVYYTSGILTKESDVYSFGVVLFEVLCGRLCIGGNDKTRSLMMLVRKHHRENNLNEIALGDIKDEIHPTSLHVFTKIAYQCLNGDQEKRPLASEIVTELETALKYQGSDVLPPPGLSDVGSSASPNQRSPTSEKILVLDSSPSDMQLDDQSNAMTDEFAELFSEQKSSSVETVYGKFKPENVNRAASNRMPFPLREFEHLRLGLDLIKHATNNFDDGNFIEEGGWWKVYKGELYLSDVSTICAVKRFDLSNDGTDISFSQEILLLSSYKHENLVSLIGYCDEMGERIILYEYASNKTLALHLHDHNLSWIQRLKICLGAACGLEYLHNPMGSQQRVLHRNIKSGTILLDENWNAKITDFSLSKYGPANQQHTFLFSNAKGTFGYCDPVYLETGLLTKESDVYSFGVVLFEVLCSRICFDLSYNDIRRSLPILVKKCYKGNELHTIIDDNLRQQIEDNCFNTFVTLAYQCLNKDQTKRPSMDLVLEKLREALQYQVGAGDHEETRNESGSESGNQSGSEMSSFLERARAVSIARARARSRARAIIRAKARATEVKKN